MSTAIAQNIARWHDAISGDNPQGAVAQMVAEDAVFHSPVVHTPQRGKALVTAYLSAASQTLANDSFTYVREVVNGDTAVLEFTSEMDGIHVNGVDIITFDDDGMIADFKVMIRPLKAVNKVWEMMAAQLKQASG